MLCHCQVRHAAAPVEGSAQGSCAAALLWYSRFSSSLASRHISASLAITSRGAMPGWRDVTWGMGGGTRVSGMQVAEISQQYREGDEKAIGF